MMSECSSSYTADLMPFLILLCCSTAESKPEIWFKSWLVISVSLQFCKDQVTVSLLRLPFFIFTENMCLFETSVFCLCLRHPKTPLKCSLTLQIKRFYPIRTACRCKKGILFRFHTVNKLYLRYRKKKTFHAKQEASDFICNSWRIFRAINY